MYTVPVGQNPSGLVCGNLFCDMTVADDYDAAAARPWDSSARRPSMTFVSNTVRFLLPFAEI
jgi:hypothetical protein